MPEEMKWDLEELKRSLLDSASDYDRIVKNMNEDDNTTFTRMGSKQDKTEEPSKE
tara:strand:+ start:67 stop:231 length:165 start_codon:yes stop_codon:yes gene_type:complete